MRNSGMATVATWGSSHLQSSVDNKTVWSYCLLAIVYRDETFLAFLCANKIQQNVKRHWSNALLSLGNILGDSEWRFQDDNHASVWVAHLAIYCIRLFESIFFRLSFFLYFFSIIFDS